MESDQAHTLSGFVRWKGRSQYRRGVEERNGWRSSCVGTNSVSGWHSIERVLPRLYVIVEIVLHLSCAPLSKKPMFSVNVCQNEGIKSFSWLHLKTDVIYVCLNCSHLRAFWPIIAASCGHSALYLFSRKKIVRNRISGMFFLCCAVMVHVVLLAHEEEHLNLLLSALGEWVYWWLHIFQRLNTFGHQLQLQVLC